MPPSSFRITVTKTADNSSDLRSLKVFAPKEIVGASLSTIIIELISETSVPNSGIPVILICIGNLGSLSALVGNVTMISKVPSSSATIESPCTSSVP